MKVLNLRCANDHGFEGWFASEQDFLLQNERGDIACPLCGNAAVKRLPSAPRLNLSGARAPASAEPAPASGSRVGGGAVAVGNGSAQVPAELQALWLKTVRQVLANTEDVGERFPEEVRRIHYGETAHRGIRGQASEEERAELADEGIEVMSLPMPVGLKGSAH
jgi:hypothetical protein